MVPSVSECCFWLSQGLLALELFNPLVMFPAIFASPCLLLSLTVMISHLPPPRPGIIRAGWSSPLPIGFRSVDPVGWLSSGRWLPGMCGPMLETFPTKNVATGPCYPSGKELTLTCKHLFLIQNLKVRGLWHHVPPHQSWIWILHMLQIKQHGMATPSR